MGLSQHARGLLDQHIDMVIKKPSAFHVKIFRIPKVKSSYHIQNEADFVLGVAYGAIQAGFNGMFIALYQRTMTESEGEVIDVVDSGMSEVREAIFKQG
jgi:hypothetical protein